MQSLFPNRYFGELVTGTRHVKRELSLLTPTTELYFSEFLSLAEASLNLAYEQPIYHMYELIFLLFKNYRVPKYAPILKQTIYRSPIHKIPLDLSLFLSLPLA
jgi:hypothetical protein